MVLQSPVMRLKVGKMQSCGRVADVALKSVQDELCDSNASQCSSPLNPRHRQTRALTLRLKEIQVGA